LSWWDIYAPVSQISRRIPFSEAETFILTQFENFSPHLSRFAKQVFDLNWIDAEPRAGKSGGVYCAGIAGVDLSRILCTYDGSLQMVFAIAHELGHAFHNHCQAGKTRLQSITPMTLAESASLFCETLVTEKAITTAGSLQEELAILDTFLSGTAVVNIVESTQHYHFEKEVFERRKQAELSADEFCEISLHCQAEIYGDCLDSQHLNPYAWVGIPHQFFSDISFYNFPYAFGLLFSLGLYAQYQDRGEAFIPDFEALLASTGEFMPAELAARFGIHLNEPDFWQTSLKLIEQRIERFEALCGNQAQFTK
jgi:oligoendopeptidase F